MKIRRLKDRFDRFDVAFPAGKPFDVVGFGTNSVDHLCTVPEYPTIESKTEILAYEQLSGGQVATTCVFLARMGLKTRYAGKVGGDDLGRYALETLRSESVDTGSVLVEQNVRNQFAFIVIDKKSGERTVLSYRDRGLDFRESELRREALCCGRVLHLDGYDAAGAVQAAGWCREEGIPVVADLDKVVEDCPTLLDNIDFLIVSSNFPSEFTGIKDPEKAFIALGESFDGFLAVTLGASGAMAWVGDRPVRFPGIKVDAVDTTGAGDIFHGGFIYGLLQNWPLEATMRFANAAAGLSCCSVGARSGIHSLSEILSRIERPFP